MNKNNEFKLAYGLKELGITKNDIYWLDDRTDPKETKAKLKSIDRYGFDLAETFSLDTALAFYIYPRLKLFKKVNKGYPGNLTWESWNEILDKMLWSFEQIILSSNGTDIESELFKEGKYKYNDKEFMDILDKHNEKIDEGLKLFGKYYRALWW